MKNGPQFENFGKKLNCLTNGKSLSGLKNKLDGHSLGKSTIYFNKLHFNRKKEWRKLFFCRCTEIETKESKKVNNQSSESGSESKVIDSSCNYFPNPLPLEYVNSMKWPSKYVVKNCNIIC